MLIENEPFYKVTNHEVDVFTHCAKNNLPLLLKGPTGTGKSRFVEHMAYRLKRPIYTVACHEETSATDLIGRFIIKGGETLWVDGPLTRAVKEGAIIYLDEIAEARPDVIVAIHPLTDFRRTLYLDKLGEEIVAHPDFLFVASYNPGYQRGFKELKPSTRQRFVAIRFEYPNEKTEIEIVMQETGASKDTAKKLVKVATKIRNLTTLRLTETVSTRLLIDAAFLIKSGLGQRISVECAMLEPLTDDIDVFNALRDITTLML